MGAGRALVPDFLHLLLLLLLAAGCRGIPVNARKDEEEDEERSLRCGTAEVARKRVGCAIC
eukprot:12914434-Heterocapsa_arctica.AAC.1